MFRRTFIREDRDFEGEYRLDAAEAGAFLVDLGEQFQAGDELTIGTDEWRLPFAFGEPVELGIEFEGVGEQELEIPGRPDKKRPTASNRVPFLTRRESSRRVGGPVRSLSAARSRSPACRSPGSVR